MTAASHLAPAFGGLAALPRRRRFRTAGRRHDAGTRTLDDRMLADIGLSRAALGGGCRRERRTPASLGPDPFNGDTP